MPSNQRSINTGGGKHWAAALTCREAAMEARYIPTAARPNGGGETDHANNISHRKNKLLHEMYRENRSTKERQGVLSTLETYEVRRIFDNFLFLRSSFTKLLECNFFHFAKTLK